MAKLRSALQDVLDQNDDSLLSEWIAEMKRDTPSGDKRVSDSEIHEQAREFLATLQQCVAASGTLDIQQKSWVPVLEMLDNISRSRVLQGFTSDQTALFIFALKKPVFKKLRQKIKSNLELLADETWNATVLLDSLGLHTIKSFQKTREEVIQRQQNELLELSTPVVKLWDGILALPMIGTLDSSRTQMVMESLLQRIVDTGSEIAIIDITGVPTVDTLVAQHLLKTVTAIRLMGADCIISGVRPQIAQTIVHLGVDLEGVTTKASLADALTLSLKRIGYQVTKSK